MSNLIHMFSSCAKNSLTINKNIFVLIACVILVLSSTKVFAQIGTYQKYSDISGSEIYSFDILEDLKYGVGKTKYQKLNNSGSYNLISQIDLELDLFVPQTPLSEGKRAVIIMIPVGGRGGCRFAFFNYLPNGDVDTSKGCDKETIVSGGLVTQEGSNYNHYNNAIASQYAQRGLIVASLNTRYNYQHTDYNVNGSNRWFRTPDGTATGSNPLTVLNTISAHLEFLVTDVKRAVRWLTANADAYNIDPNYIFVDGASGGAKMAALAAFTNNNQLIVDDPANIDVAFETANNNWAIRNSTPGIKGAILRKGDPNGTYHMNLMDTMDAHTNSFMFWAGTADNSILHGMSEVIEEKCEILQTCSTQFYSLPNKTHTSASSATFPHTKSGNQASPSHVYDFIVNTIYKDSQSLPTLSINKNATSFNESVGNAQIEIVRTGNASAPVTFTVTADQLREVTLENATQGTFDSITKYVAKSSNSDGIVMYNQSTGYAYEDAFGGNLRNYKDRTLTHTIGPGAGQYTEISSADSEYHNIDFTGKSQVLTMAAGQRSVYFSVPILNDTLLEDNECFNVRLLNAYGAQIGNSVETFTIIDNDKTNPQSSAVCANSDSGGQTPVTPSINFSSATKSVSEGGNVQLTFVSDKVPSENISIQYKTVSGTASTADFKWVNAFATIPAGQTSVNVTIQTTEDLAVESSESFTVDMISIVGGVANIGSVSSTIVTIVDNDVQPVITMSQSSVTVNEGAARVLTITSDRATAENISIQYQTRQGSATSSDFTAVFKNAVIPAGAQTVNVSISTVDDSLVELDEIFTVSINQIIAGNARVGAQDTTQVKIVDNDSLPVITIQPDSKFVTEGNTFLLTIEADQSSSQAITVEYQTSQGTASISDFVWVRNSVTIPAGQTSVNVPIETVDDLSVENNENFIVFLREITAGNAEFGSPAVSTITIIDNDVIPVISISPESRNVSEGDIFVLTISSNRAVSEAISVEYQTRVGSASTSDFEWVRRTAVIPFGDTSVEIILSTIEDQLVEANETYSVALIGITGEANIGSQDTTTINIIDDDTASTQPIISISPANKSTQEGSFIGLTISANKVVASAVSVEYITRPITATSGLDFVWTREKVIIPAGSRSVDIAIETREDTLVEGDQTFKVDLIDIIGNAQFGATTSSILTIIDDDINSTVANISFSTAAISVVEGSYTGLTITADKQVANAVVVEYQTRSISATTNDYEFVKNTATIPAGASSISIAIKTIEDTIPESDETFKVDLNSVVSGNAILGPQNSSVITILDIPIISMTPTAKVSEGEWLSLTISANRILASDVTIEYTTRALTATSGVDYTWLRKYAVIPAGSRNVDVAIQTKEDSALEADETFRVDIESVSGNAKVGSTSSSIITILDDETTPTLFFSKSEYRAEEGATVLLTIVSDRPVLSAVEIEYQTQGWTASPDDFVWTKKTATIPVGQSSVGIWIQTLKDEIEDEPEEFRVNLNRIVSGNAVLATNKSTTVWIDAPCAFHVIPIKNKAIVICL